MGVSGGPNIIRDSSLILELDAADRNSYPGSGTAWNDVSRNNNATLTNSPTFNSANGGYLTYNGSNQSANMSAAAGTFGTGDFTISFWWKSTAAQSNFTTVIGQGFTGSPSSGAWAFKVSHTTNVINFSYCTPSISDNVTTTNPNDNIWHNIVATRTGTSLYLYMDNILLTTITLPGGFSFGANTTTYIGYNPRDNVYMNGSLSSILTYNKILSVTEIQQNYNALKSRFGLI